VEAVSVIAVTDSIIRRKYERYEGYERGRFARTEVNLLIAVLASSLG
jgi:hypothetical protein